MNDIGHYSSAENKLLILNNHDEFLVHCCQESINIIKKNIQESCFLSRWKVTYLLIKECIWTPIALIQKMYSLVLRLFYILSQDSKQSYFKCTFSFIKAICLDNFNMICATCIRIITLFIGIFFPKQGMKGLILSEKFDQASFQTWANFKEHNGYGDKKFVAFAEIDPISAKSYFDNRTINSKKMDSAENQKIADLLTSILTQIQQEHADIYEKIVKKKSWETKELKNIHLEVEKFFGLSSNFLYSNQPPQEEKSLTDYFENILNNQKSAHVELFFSRIKAKIENSQLKNNVEHSPVLLKQLIAVRCLFSQQRHGAVLFYHEMSNWIVLNRMRNQYGLLQTL